MFKVQWQQYLRRGRALLFCINFFIITSFNLIKKLFLGKLFAIFLERFVFVIYRLIYLIHNYNDT
jgi:hypothetical protein